MKIFDNIAKWLDKFYERLVLLEDIRKIKIAIKRAKRLNKPELERRLLGKLLSKLNKKYNMEPPDGTCSTCINKIYIHDIISCVLTKRHTAENYYCQHYEPRMLYSTRKGCE